MILGITDNAVMEAREFPTEKEAEAVRDHYAHQFRDFTFRVVPARKPYYWWIEVNTTGHYFLGHLAP